MPVKTKLVFLMHPHEVKRVKAGTGRFTALSFEDAEIVMGIEFDQCERVRQLIEDPANAPMLLYPGATAKNLSEGALSADDLGGRRLVVFLIDATWALAKKMLRLSPSLQALPRVMFTPREKSKFVIKHQPHELCLSTLEATHELMLALEASGLDTYPRKGQLPDVFRDMQAFQLSCAADPERKHFHRGPPGAAEARREARKKAREAGLVAPKRSLFFRDKLEHGETVPDIGKEPG